MINLWSDWTPIAVSEGIAVFVGFTYAIKKTCNKWLTHHEDLDEEHNNKGKANNPFIEDFVTDTQEKDEIELYIHPKIDPKPHLINNVNAEISQNQYPQAQVTLDEKETFYLQSLKKVILEKLRAISKKATKYKKDNSQLYPESQEEFIDLLHHCERIISTNPLSEGYSLFNFYAERFITKNVAQKAFLLKQIMPSKWAQLLRKDIRDLGAPFQEYLNVRKKQIAKYTSASFFNSLTKPPHDVSQAIDNNRSSDFIAKRTDNYTIHHNH